MQVVLVASLIFFYSSRAFCEFRFDGSTVAPSTSSHPCVKNALLITSVARIRNDTERIKYGFRHNSSSTQQEEMFKIHVRVRFAGFIKTFQGCFINTTTAASDLCVVSSHVVSFRILSSSLVLFLFVIPYNHERSYISNNEVSTCTLQYQYNYCTCTRKLSLFRLKMSQLARHIATRARRRRRRRRRRDRRHARWLG
jgi:hypothetical protein